jgi:hypothetical protein
MDQKRSLLRHFLAALADRTQKTLRGARLEFASFRAAPKVRTSHDLILHMDDVPGYSQTSFIRPPDRTRRNYLLASEI